MSLSPGDEEEKLQSQNEQARQLYNEPYRTSSSSKIEFATTPQNATKSYAANCNSSQIKRLRWSPGWNTRWPPCCFKTSKICSHPTPPPSLPYNQSERKLVVASTYYVIQNSHTERIHTQTKITKVRTKIPAELSFGAWENIQSTQCLIGVLFPLWFLPAAIWRQRKDLLQIAIDHRTPDVWIQFRSLWCCSSQQTR